ncbi:phosphoadenosine phosphosulfate reductase family domain containing protein, putative [Babesia bigemina]|uniref:FAD synthase n=1 Tax=Babesia bigemina TaxID=5866 RepID=A0A061D659_BABBI|nr:phosphoadenosine phosphosulfate reductase family domain containing protein, putative [Babesia bigemina]CDR95502.1 phosphoadenosine phosphosulfate reductase family domain containing protein, putative [Babesia bigemina]|eukprot:XP_012767688.1 phosphoadenosine phosphosulfate reductase family domain containing protein, putative [Babesia bigemina]
MSRSWDQLKVFGQLLSVPLQRHVLGDEESAKLATLVNRAVTLLFKAYSNIGHDNVYVSFNGGKDSVAVLHLHRLASSFPDSGVAAGRPLNVVFFKDPAERLFPEITEFVDHVAKKYNFKVKVVEDVWHKGIPQIAAGRKAAFVLGCRSTDFEGSQISEIEEGSTGGVEFVRIHPLSQWSYGDVWNFLRLFSFDYCSLYDIGYTSVGSVDDTIANPHLKKPDGTYAPAYKLQNWSLERSGRTKTSTK